MHTDFVPLRREISMPETHEDLSVIQMHDGSSVRLRHTAPDYNPTDRNSAYAHVRACQARGEIATGLLFIDEGGRDMHDMMKTVQTPLVDVPFSKLCPGSAALDKLMARYR